MTRQGLLHIGAQNPGKLFNYGGLLCTGSELAGVINYVMEARKEAMTDAIYQETGERSYTTEITAQDDDMTWGTFKTASGKTGRFSILKNIAAVPLVWLDA